MRTARSVGIAIDDELRQALDEVVEHYAGGNRSEFLRRAVRDYQSRLRLERMHSLRGRARAEAGGRILAFDEIMSLVKAETGSAGADPA